MSRPEDPPWPGAGVRATAQHLTPMRLHAGRHDEARAAIAVALGKHALADLHRQIWVLDVLAVTGAPVLFVALAVYLGLASFGPAWIVAFLVQGCVIITLAYVNHDVCVHRSVFSPRVNRALSRLLTLPSQLSPTVYEYAHLKHHRHLGSELDTEAYKKDIDSPGRRLLFATFVGAKLASMGRLGSMRSKVYPPVFDAMDERLLDRIVWDRRFRRGALALTIAVAVFFPGPVLYGYALPLVVVTPLVNSLRIVLEHFEFDKENAFALGTFYRTGIVTRVLFFWDAGDCHVIHHLYPRIPFYRMGSAVRVCRPLLLSCGVVERRSILMLLRDWFVLVRPYWSRLG